MGGGGGGRGGGGEGEGAEAVSCLPGASEVRQRILHGTDKLPISF